MTKFTSATGFSGALVLLLLGLNSYASDLGVEGAELTPVGALRAGNEQGTIPPWEGGLKTPPEDYKEGYWYTDPFGSDQPLFRITRDNYEQYREHLSAGQVALFKRYPESFFMDVYPSHRSASYPDWYLQASSKGEARGLPHPVPETGYQAMINHTYYYRGAYKVSVEYGFGVYVDGTYQDTAAKETRFYPHHDTMGSVQNGDRLADLGGAIDCFLFETLTPARSAGRLISGCKFREKLNQDVSIYTPGLRRVQLITNSMTYDNPVGEIFTGIYQDQRDIFTLSENEQNYEFDKPNRVEKFIAYNSYKLAAPGLSLDDIIRPGHLNQELKRYELHRVWEIRATIKPGKTHSAPQRTAYLDEDSWAGATGDLYNVDGELFRTSEAQLLNFYNVPMLAAWGDNHMDLGTGRHFSYRGFANVGISDGNLPPDFGQQPEPGLFSQAGLRKLGVR